MPDTLFPLPSPTLLFVYTMAVHPIGVSPSVTSEGVLVASVGSGTSVFGYITGTGRQERPQEVGEIVARAVALVPDGTVVKESDRLKVPTQPGLGAHLVGWWEIAEVRHNPSHIRLILKRDDRMRTAP